MLALPSLAAVPRSYSAGVRNPLAAKLALSLAGAAEPQKPRRRAASIEIDVLQAQLAAWLGRMNAAAQFIAPRLHLALNMGPLDWGGERHEDLYTLWLMPGLPLGTEWTLERRWKALEARAPGLAGAALDALEHAGRHAFVLYTPGMAEFFATHCWWMGCDDESEVLLNMDQPDEDGEYDFPTRAWFDRVLPRCVTRPHGMKRSRLERYVRKGGDVAAIARLVLELQAECQAAHRRRRHDFDFESQDDNGFRAIGTAALLRWNERDPMLRVFDDYANLAAQEGCDDALGWFLLEDAEDLPKVLGQLERMFAIARKMEALVPLVATRSRP